MNPQTTTIPDWKLDRYLLGELPEQELAAIRERAESDQILQSRIRELQDADETVRATYPTADMVAAIRDRAAGESTPARPRNWLWAALPAAAALILMLNPGAYQEPTWPNRLKGGDPMLFLYRKTSDGIEQLQSGDTAREHDLIQIKYTAGTEKYGVILSIDGRGTITTHLPESGTRAAELKKGQADTLAFSYELDDAPEGEHFYFVTRNEPFDLSEVRNALEAVAFKERLTKLDLPRTYTQHTFSLKKDSRHEP